MTTNKEIRDQFLKIARERGLTPATVYRYRRWIRKFLQFHDGIALEHVELEEVDAFLKSLSHLSKSTQHQAQNALNVIFEGVLKKNLNVSLDRPRQGSYFSVLKCWMRRKLLLDRVANSFSSPRPSRPFG